MPSGIVLDERLKTIAQLIGPCETVADIGADHGRLGAYLLQTGQVQRVQFCDISPDSLAKSRRLIERVGLTTRASFFVGDGVHAMTGPADAVVIAGMGGQLIASIIEAGRDKLVGSRLILQPNVAAPELRRRLSHAGFRIDQERVVRAANRLYVVIAAGEGQARYSERELVVGPCLIQGGDPLMKPYAERRLRIAKEALAGAQAGGADWAHELQRECELWEAVLHGES